jgi:hypothetical protein
LKTSFVFLKEKRSYAFWLTGRTIGYRVPLRWPETSLSQGAEWKALISKYIGTIPLSGDAACPAEQSILIEPPPRTPVSKAMIAKVGAAARHSQSARPEAAAWPPPLHSSAMSFRVGFIVADP